MKIISWDIGIINLAYCIMDYQIENDVEKINILKWDTIDIREPNHPKKKNVTKISEILVKKVSSEPELLNVDYVLIENQPCMKNPVMKSIQMILYTLYIMCKNGKYIINDISNEINIIKQIHLISASNKLKVYDGPKIELTCKSSYTRRKKLSILHTQYLLKDNEEKLKYLNNHKKKDDLCDTYLQALYFVKNKKKFKYQY